jgi:hypothetical protein
LMTLKLNFPWFNISESDIYRGYACMSLRTIFYFDLENLVLWARISTAL